LEREFAVILHPRVLLSFALKLAAVVGLIVFTGVPADSGEKPPSREQRIADLQKQLEALTKQLNDLKMAPAETTPSVADGALPADWVKTLSWRCIGPAVMGGRITAISVFEADPTCYYVATASGGLLKTVNNGITFEHQFDRESTVSIGDVCVAPSDRSIVWVGTGEANPRNSVSYGDGVYKSTDGGKTWKRMGLEKTFQIGRIAIHPTNPDIVYVGALGRLYGPNPERGLYKTTDGGKTWAKVLYINDKTGVMDMQMHPTDPNTLIVAMWERMRDGHDSHVGDPALADGMDGYDPAVRWGPGSGLYKTTDGGTTFKKLQTGLPTCDVGRIGIDYYRKNPNTLVAVIDSSKFGMGTPPSDVYAGIRGFDAKGGGANLVQIVAKGPAEKAGLKSGDIARAVDQKPVEGYMEFVDLLSTYPVGAKVKVKVTRGTDTKEYELTLEKRPADQPNLFGGSKTRPWGEKLGAQRANIQDRQGPDSHQYGGLYKSTDGGETWKRINSINPRPMYFSVVRIDPSDDTYLYMLGVQLFRSKDGGKTFKSDGSRGVHSDQHALWINPRDGRHMIVGTDGGFYVTYDRMDHWDHLNHMEMGQFYHVAVDNRRPYRVYGGLQDNASWGGPSHTLNGAGPINEDWIFVSGGDGFVCRVDPHDPDMVYSESQDGNIRRRNLRTGEQALVKPKGGKGGPKHRFNWNTPFILSSHNPRIFYSAGEVVFKSVKQGDELRIISPEITRTKRGSATALAESPRNPELLWVGTDDGALWVTRDGGVNWINLTEKLNLRGPRWVSTIEPSRFEEGRCYVCLDAHRSDDDEPYVLVTEDFGQTWRSLRANLPWGSSRCLREDIENPNLLFVGTEFALWASLNRGGSWTKINNNLPTVAVHEVAIHPTAGEIVAATHGRSLWILDVTALRQMTAEVVKAPAHLYRPNKAVRWRAEPGRGSPFGNGSRHFVGENPLPGAQIYYSLTRPATKASLKVVDIAGKTVRELETKTEAGLHRVSWNLASVGAGGAGKGLKKFGGKGGGKGAPPKIAGGGPKGKGQGQFGGKGGGFGGPGGAGGAGVPAGTYRVVLIVDDQEFTQTVQVEGDPVQPPVLIAPDDDDDGKERK
jgi:photosystem II stability/assembly factor-like uncharacterized protein